VYVVLLSFLILDFFFFFFFFLIPLLMPLYRSLLFILVDTLPCYPFKDKDPFIISASNFPSVFFAGNQVSVAI
jgi:hypothetical protein